MINRLNLEPSSSNASTLATQLTADQLLTRLVDQADESVPMLVKETLDSLPHEWDETDDCLDQVIRVLCWCREEYDDVRRTSQLSPNMWSMYVEDMKELYLRMQSRTPGSITSCVDVTAVVLHASIKKFSDTSGIFESTHSFFDSCGAICETLSELLTHLTSILRARTDALLKARFGI